MMAWDKVSLVRLPTLPMMTVTIVAAISVSPLSAKTMPTAGSVSVAAGDVCPGDKDDGRNAVLRSTIRSCSNQSVGYINLAAGTGRIFNVSLHLPSWCRHNPISSSTRLIIQRPVTSTPILLHWGPRDVSDNLGARCTDFILELHLKCQKAGKFVVPVNLSYALPMPMLACGRTLLIINATCSGQHAVPGYSLANCTRAQPIHFEPTSFLLGLSLALIIILAALSIGVHVWTHERTQSKAAFPDSDGVNSKLRRELTSHYGRWLVAETAIEKLEVFREGSTVRLLRGRARINNCWMKVVGKSPYRKVSEKTYHGSIRFIETAMSMRDFCHANILHPAAVSLAPNNPPVVLFPDLSQTNLLEFLKDNNSHGCHSGNESILLGDALTETQLASFARDVCSGIMYIMAQGHVHGDISARNCIVTGNQHVKITDNSLAQDFHPDHYQMVEQRRGPIMLPVRWTASEILFDEEERTFSSEKWSFAVTMWEIFSLGEYPYQQIATNKPAGLCNYLHSGSRLERPQKCPEHLYSIMTACWSLSQDVRPTFDRISRALAAACELAAAYSPVSSHIPSPHCHRSSLHYAQRQPAWFSPISSASLSPVKSPVRRTAFPSSRAVQLNDFRLGQSENSPRHSVWPLYTSPSGRRRGSGLRRGQNVSREASESYSIHPAPSAPVAMAPVAMVELHTYAQAPDNTTRETETKLENEMKAEGESQKCTFRDARTHGQSALKRSSLSSSAPTVSHRAKPFRNPVSVELFPAAAGDREYGQEGIRPLSDGPDGMRVTTTSHIAQNPDRSSPGLEHRNTGDPLPPTPCGSYEDNLSMCLQGHSSPSRSDAAISAVPSDEELELDSGVHMQADCPGLGGDFAMI